jgi:hypothetical protein
MALSFERADMNRQYTHRLFGILVLILAAMPAIGEEFKARLGRTPVDSRNQASITGLGNARAELDGSRLEIAGEFTGLVGAATIANLHMGRAVGVRGEVIHALTLTQDVEGEIKATLELSPDQLAALRAGRLYIQIHSTSAPDGNLWGWLLDE